MHVGIANQGWLGKRSRHSGNELASALIILNYLGITIIVSDRVDISYLIQKHYWVPHMHISHVCRATTDLKLNLGGTISPCGGKWQLWLAGCGPTGQINTRKETLGLLMSPRWRRKMKYSMCVERCPHFDCAMIASWHGCAFRITFFVRKFHRWPSHSPFNVQLSEFLLFLWRSYSNRSIYLTDTLIKSGPNGYIYKESSCSPCDRYL